MAGVSEEIRVGEDGETVPVMEVLTGRGFVTGKSGSGKSNTASVVAEALLDEGLPLLVVDTDGEYYGLKAEYELLHVGADDRADVQIGPDRADALATLALEENVPVILDVSGFVEQSEANELIDAVVSALFAAEAERRKPFLLLVEELHEFVPESGGFGDVGETLVRVAKRGRKRGLGVCGMSQRPAAVDKDYITQCDWIVWHRLTWNNDTRVVERILGSDAAADVESLDTGEAIVVTDWDERTRRIRFRRKRTFDAGATPDLTDVDQPDLKTIDSELLDRIESDSDERGGDENKRETARTDTRAGADSADTNQNAAATGQRPAGTAPDGEGEAGGAGDSDDDGGTAAAGAPGPGVDPDPQRDRPLWEFGQLVWFLLVRLAAGFRAGLVALGRGTRSALGRVRDRMTTAGRSRGDDEVNGDGSTGDESSFGDDPLGPDRS